MSPKRINCLFAENKAKKYIIVDESAQIGFAHLMELTAYLDSKIGKGNYQLKFNYAKL